MNFAASTRGAPAVKPLALACAMSLSLFAGAAAAQDDIPSTVVITGSRFPSVESLRPIGATVITQDDIRRAGASDVNSAIRKIGGVFGRQSLDSSPDFALDLRGFGTNSAQNMVIMVDGVRLNENELANTVLSTIPIDTVERIEITRGGGSVLYGEGATGGVIQVTTRRNVAGGLHGSVFAEGGSFHEHDLRASLSQTAGDVSADIAVARQGSNNYRRNSDFDQTTASLNVQTRFTGGRAGIHVESARQDSRLPGSLSLAQFDAEDVESFIECRLLETDADVPMDVAGPSPDESVGVATEVYVKPREKLALHLRRLARKLPPRFQQPALRAVPYAPYIAVAVICIVVGLVIGRTGRRTPPAPAPVVAAAPTPAPAPPAPDPQPPAPEPVAVQEAPKPAVPSPPTRTERRAPAPKPVAEAPEPAAEAERPARAEKPAAAAKPEPIAAAERPARAEKPAPRPAPTAAPATGNCTARIVTEPKDAKVIWGGAMIGRSPIDSARVPCGPATVTIERERWQPVTVDVDAQAGTAADVHERLHRPRATLSITSTPPGARVVINRVAAGAAPKEVDVQRFEKLQIKASLKGYQPWTKTVYLRDADANLDITLVPRK